MKTGLACLAGTAVDGTALHASSSLKSKRAVSRTSLKTLRSIPTTCGLCPSGCGILAFLDGDRCVQILGNPSHPVNRGGICAKGISGLNLVNDPERLLFPMKRIGKRGEAQWTRITWDEAHHLMISRIVQSNVDKQNFGFIIDQGQSDLLLDRFIRTMEVPSIINRPALNRRNINLANRSMTGVPTLIPDIGRSQTVLNFGANPFANHDLFLGLAHRLMEARMEYGSKLFTFDIRMSETAAKSDLWLPVKSGTDGIVALAMAHTILKNDLVDADFISKKTNTSLSALKSHLSAYPPSWAEEESGIKASDIENIAIEFATHKPSVAIVGGGVADHKNGVENSRSILLLNLLVGNLEKEGGLYYSRSPHSISSRLSGSQKTKTLNGTRELAESGTKVNLYLSYLANPVFDEPNTPLIKQYFEDDTKIKFLAVLDTHMTETAMLADLVLPAATYLESWGLEHGPSLDQISVLSLRQPAVSLQSPAKILRSPDFDVGKVIDPSFRPRGEAKEVGNVCIEWAQRIGGKVGQSFQFKNSLEFYAQEVEHIQNPASSGGIIALKRDGFRIETEPVESQVPSENIEKEGLSILPDYQADESPKKKNEFTLTTNKPGFFVKGTMNSKWLREISHDNPLWINRKSAKNLGIQNGDPLRISSENGSLVVRALVTDRIHPKSVALAEGFGHTATGRIAKAEKFKSSDRDTLLLWWGKEGKGINPNELIRGKADPSSGVFASKDTSVRIEKI